MYVDYEPRDLSAFVQLHPRDFRSSITPTSTQKTTLIVAGCYVIAIGILWCIAARWTWRIAVGTDEARLLVFLKAYSVSELAKWVLGCFVKDGRTDGRPRISYSVVYPFKLLTVGFHEVRYRDFTYELYLTPLARTDEPCHRRPTHLCANRKPRARSYVLSTFVDKPWVLIHSNS